MDFHPQRIYHSDYYCVDYNGLLDIRILTEYSPLELTSPRATALPAWILDPPQTPAAPQKLPGCASQKHLQTVPFFLSRLLLPIFASDPIRVVLKLSKPVILEEVRLFRHTDQGLLLPKTDIHLESTYCFTSNNSFVHLESQTPS